MAHAEINVPADAILEAIGSTIPRWGANSDPSWSAAQSTNISRRVWRVDFHLSTGKRSAHCWDWYTIHRWVAVDDYGGPAYPDRPRSVDISAAEPKPWVGGWGGGEGKVCEVGPRRSPVVHIYQAGETPSPTTSGGEL